jgi:hypothetical protein
MSTDVTLPPKGRPPTFEKSPSKFYAYLSHKAAILKIDQSLIKVPGVNAPAGSKLEFPSELLGKLHVASLNKATTAKGQAVHGGYSLVVPPAPVKQESDEEVLTRVAGQFKALTTMTNGVCEGKTRSLIVHGAGGVGKSFTVERVVNHHVEHNGVKAQIVSGVLTAIQLFMLLYKNRAKGYVTVLDDADGVFWDEDAITILKAATDTGHFRKLSWLSNSSSLKQNNVDPEFLYEGSMIFISNLDFNGYIKNAKGKQAQHIQAMMTRPICLDLRLHSERDVVLWIKYMINKNHILQTEKGLLPEQEQEVLSFMMENRAKIKNLSIRTAMHLGDMVNIGGENWKQLAHKVILND